MKNLIQIIWLGTLLSWPLWAQEVPEVDRSRRVIPTIVNEVMDTGLCATGQACWVEVVYRSSPHGDPIFSEPGERVWWLGEVPLIVLGASGVPLPRTVTERNEIFIEMWIDGEPLHTEPIALRPAREAIPVYAQSESMSRALKASLAVDIDASYLSQVVNFMVGNVATLAINGTSYELDGQTIVSEDGMSLPGQFMPDENNIPMEGAGTRMMWYPGKSALRVGRVNGDQWDENKVGTNSFAFGSNNQASHGCFVAGSDNLVSGASTTFGSEITNHSILGFATGYKNTIGGFYNTVMGYENYIGFGSARENFVLGSYCSASGDNGFALGRRANAEHDGVFVWGDHVDADFSSTADDQFLIRASGGLGVGTNAPNAQLHIDDSLSLDPFRVDINGTRHLLLQNDGRLVVGTEDAHGSSLDVLSVEAPASMQAFRVRLGGATKMRVHSNGGTSIGFNTTPPVDGLHVNGNLSKGGGSFKIDHPLDPANKYLYHSFVEAPDMMNIYNGRAVLNERGRAEVIMPDYFEALNRDFRYQLTAIGAPAPNLHIAQEISDGLFAISGGQPGQVVCWSVTGIRQDVYANANRIPVEEEKAAADRGTYLHPQAFGLKRQPEK